MIDTAGTVTRRRAGAPGGLGAQQTSTRSRRNAAPVGGPAVERLRASAIKTRSAVTTRSGSPTKRIFDKLKGALIAGLMAKAIGYEHSNQSVSALFRLNA